MSERKPMTLEELREVPHGKIKDETLRSICDRANEIAAEPPRIDRSACEPCEQCRNGNTIIDIPGCDEFRLVYKGKSNEQMHFLFQFPFCPHCGRPLTDAAWEMLERRLAGREHQ